MLLRAFENTKSTITFSGRYKMILTYSTLYRVQQRLKVLDRRILDRHSYNRPCGIPACLIDKLYSYASQVVWYSDKFCFLLCFVRRFQLLPLAWRRYNGRHAIMKAKLFSVERCRFENFASLIRRNLPSPLV